MTEYVILFKQDGAWKEMEKRIPARSGSSALRTLLANESPGAIEWVAVPARSFRPVKVKVETKTSLKFS